MRSGPADRQHKVSKILLRDSARQTAGKYRCIGASRGGNNPGRKSGEQSGGGGKAFAAKPCFGIRGVYRNIFPHGAFRRNIRNRYAVTACQPEIFRSVFCTKQQKRFGGNAECLQRARNIHALSGSKKLTAGNNIVPADHKFFRIIMNINYGIDRNGENVRHTPSSALARTISGSSSENSFRNSSPVRFSFS